MINTDTLMGKIHVLRLLSFQEGCLWATMNEGPGSMYDLDAKYEAKQKEILESLLDIQRFVNAEESISV